MNQITLITGGARSGKSAHCQKMAEKISGPRTFIATCPAIDQEMKDRIERHQKERANRGWLTIEEQLNLPATIVSRPSGETILVDCLTLWINNLLFAEQGDDLDESGMAAICTSLLDCCRARSGKIFFVTNEVGLGIVPDNTLARRFRDLSGRCNQIMAGEADNVVFMVAGIPQIIKGTNPWIC